MAPLHAESPPDVVSPALSPEVEAERLSALEQYDLLDTTPEENFDRIVRLIQNIFDVPTAVVSLMDGHRQWHKACAGTQGDEAERNTTICRYPVATGRLLVVNDASLDPALSSNPHVLATNGIRFYAGAPLQTRDGHTIGTVCAISPEPRAFSDRDAQILTDLARVTMDEIELRQQVETDVLTGLLSRRAFKEQASRAVNLSRRHNHPLACLAIDIDHFKLVNDTYGHSAGDVVLASVAATCRRVLRATDLLGRMGGEEFAALLPHTGPADALKVAEKIRQEIRRRLVGVAGAEVKVTASIGIASLSSAADNLDALLERADKALYDAKAQGRDRCVSSSASDGFPSRRRVLKGGKIIFNNRFSTIDCTVRSLSDEGAGIDIWNAHDVPEDFELVISPEGLKKRCKVVARAEKHLEVEFLQAA